MLGRLWFLASGVVIMKSDIYFDQQQRTKHLKDLFYNNHGYLQIKELRSHGLKLTDVRQLQEQGIIARVDQGLYRWMGESEHSYLSDVIAVVPDGVICLMSALYFHNLIDHQPSICYVAVPQKHIDYLLPAFPKIQLITMTDKHRNVGLIEVAIGDDKVKIFDVEKTLCDCLRYRNRISDDIISMAFENYKINIGVNEKLIWHYGEELRMKLILKRFLPKLL